MCYIQRYYQKIEISLPFIGNEILVFEPTEPKLCGESSDDELAKARALRAFAIVMRPADGSGCK